MQKVDNLVNQVVEGVTESSEMATLAFYIK